MNAAHLHMVKIFRLCVIMSLCIVVTASLLSWCFKDVVFAGHVGIAGGLNVALFAAYVVWIVRTITASKASLDTDRTGDVATRIASLIQIVSLIKLFVTAALLVVLIVGFKLNPVAVLIGISGIYLSCIVAPLLIMPTDSAEPDPDGSTEVTEDTNK